VNLALEREKLVRQKLCSKANVYKVGPTGELKI